MPWHDDEGAGKAGNGNFGLIQHSADVSQEGGILIEDELIRPGQLTGLTAVVSGEEALPLTPSWSAGWLEDWRP